MSANPQIPPVPILRVLGLVIHKVRSDAVLDRALDESQRVSLAGPV